MECRATGNPTPHIHWRRGDGRTIQVNKNKMSARSRNASVQGETKGNTLFLEKVSRDDSGVFVCVAQNGVDTKTEVSAEIQLHVLCELTFELSKTKSKFSTIFSRSSRDYCSSPALPSQVGSEEAGTGVSSPG